ncbi:unnamed protein product [Auanema sp. JU1783]|nr:unnamed protein product [Auanema sp. JU1783]
MPPSRSVAKRGRVTKARAPPKKTTKVVKKAPASKKKNEKTTPATPKKVTKKAPAKKTTKSRKVTPKQEKVEKKVSVIDAPEEEPDKLVENWLDKHHQPNSHNGTAMVEGTYCRNVVTEDADEEAVLTSPNETSDDIEMNNVAKAETEPKDARKKEENKESDETEKLKPSGKTVSSGKTDNNKSDKDIEKKDESKANEGRKVSEKCIPSAGKRRKVDYCCEDIDSSSANGGKQDTTRKLKPGVSCLYRTVAYGESILKNASARVVLGNRLKNSVLSCFGVPMPRPGFAYEFMFNPYCSCKKAHDYFCSKKRETRRQRKKYRYVREDNNHCVFIKRSQDSNPAVKSEKHSLLMTQKHACGTVFMRKEDASDCPRDESHDSNENCSKKNDKTDYTFISERIESVFAVKNYNQERCTTVIRKIPANDCELIERNLRNVCIGIEESCEGNRALATVKRVDCVLLKKKDTEECILFKNKHDRKSIVRMVYVSIIVLTTTLLLTFL